MASTKHHSLLPVFSLLFSASLWGVFWYPLRIMEEAGINGLWSTLLIYLGTLPVLLYFLRGHTSEIARSPFLLMGIALASGWCNTAFILAILDGNVVRVLLLFYLSPLWATLLGWFFLKEHIHRSTLMVLLFALTGAGIMLWRPETGLPFPHDTSDWLALSSGLAFAISNAFIRKAHRVAVNTKTAISWLGAIILAGIFITITSTPLGTPSILAMGSAFVFGALIMTTMTLAVVYGVSNMPLHRSAVILLFEIVAGAISSLLLTNEVITFHEWLGGSFVILAAFFSGKKQVV